MIRSEVALEALLERGRTVAYLAEMAGATKFRWVVADTGEPVHRRAVNRVVWKGLCRVVATDICGDPIQLGGASRGMGDETAPSLTSDGRGRGQ